MSKLLRIRQIDAIILDEEIFKMLKMIIEDGTKYLAPGLLVPFEPEIDLVLRLFILSKSLWKNDCTFGQQLLLIKYDNLTTFKKILYIFLSSSSYFREKFAFWKPSHKINKIFDLIDGIYKILHFINLSVFLKTGRLPSLVDRILGLDQVYSVKLAPREQTSKFLTRELLWNGLIELLVFVLPLINYQKIKRYIKEINPYKSKPKSSVHTNKARRIYDLRTKCPSCKESPIKPHHMGCAHIFCYVCLKSNLMVDEKYECPICGFAGEKCESILIM